MKKLLVVMSMLCMVVSASAQTVIENVYKASLFNTGVIREGGELKGYFSFYASDKVDRKNYQWTLRVFDVNMVKLTDITFVDSKSISVLETSFNGTDLIFLVYNSSDRTFEYQVFGANGKKKHSYFRELTKKEKRYLETSYLAMDDDENTYRGMYPIEGKGFISNMPSREDKDFTFQIDYFSSEKKRQWTWYPTMSGKVFMGEFLGTYNGVAFIQMFQMKNRMDQRPDCYLIGLNMETGKQVFEKQTDAKHRFYPTHLTVLDNGSAVVHGEYYDLNANLYKDKSRGFAVWAMDEKGKILAEKYNAWDMAMGKVLNVNAKGKIDDFGYVYLHSMIEDAQGNVYAVGEGIRKSASALGIAGAILSQGRANISTVKIKVTDMIVIKFDKNFDVKEAKIFEKRANSIELPGGHEFVTIPMLGRMIKYNYGGFDYSYSQVTKDKSQLNICYRDWLKEKGYKGGSFNSISYTDGKMTQDQIRTNSDASSIAVFPGKPGQVMIAEYYRKDKQIKYHFEKLN